MSPADDRSLRAAVVDRVLDRNTDTELIAEFAALLGIDRTDPWGKRGSNAYTEHGRDEG